MTNLEKILSGALIVVTGACVAIAGKAIKSRKHQYEISDEIKEMTDNLIVTLDDMEEL